MACGSSCGLAANGRRLTAPGLVFRAAYCMSDFKPGSSKAFGNRYSALCCVSMVANDASSGNGNRWTVAPALLRWVEATQAIIQPIGPRKGAKFISWLINMALPYPYGLQVQTSMINGRWMTW